MNKRNIGSIITLISCIFLILNSNLVNCVNFVVLDSTHDLMHIVDGVTVATEQAVYPEIDIVSMEINESVVMVDFLETPIYSYDNFYDLIIYWDGNDVKNFTSGHWTQEHTNSQTCLVNGTGHVIVNVTIFDSINLIGNTLYFPILNASLISRISNPDTGIMDTRHRILGGDFFRDVLEFGTESVPGFGSVVVITGLLTSVFITFRKKRERNH